MAEFYWCLDHDRVEADDSDCPPDKRLGPYPSRQAAANWRATTKARNEAWDSDEEDDSDR